MMEEVERDQPFGSFFAFTELPDLPYVEATSSSFRSAAQKASGLVRQSLIEAADELEVNEDTWSRNVEQALYRGYGAPYPLNLA
jgi:hypothetical protein